MKFGDGTGHRCDGDPDGNQRVEPGEGDVWSHCMIFDFHRFPIPFLGVYFRASSLKFLDIQSVRYYT